MNFIFFIPGAVAGCESLNITLFFVPGGVVGVVAGV
jgi:hypothetical protein